MPSYQAFPFRARRSCATFCATFRATLGATLTPRPSQKRNTLDASYSSHIRSHLRRPNWSHTSYTGLDTL